MPLVREQESSRVWLLADLGSEPAAICTIDGKRRVRYFGTNGDDVLFLQFHSSGVHLLWACNTRNGAVRTLDGIHPMWWDTTLVGDQGLWLGRGWTSIQAGV